MDPILPSSSHITLTNCWSYLQIYHCSYLSIPFVCDARNLDLFPSHLCKFIWFLWQRTMIWYCCFVYFWTWLFSFFPSLVCRILMFCYLLFIMWQGDSYWYSTRRHKWVKCIFSLFFFKLVFVESGLCDVMMLFCGSEKRKEKSLV